MGNSAARSERHPGAEHIENKYWIMVRENRIRSLKDSFLKNQITCDDVVNLSSNHTILHEIVVMDRKDLFRLCTIYGDSANWEKSDHYGSTALMKASGLGRAFYVNQLLKAGANPLTKDNDGKTAYDYAVLFQQYDIMDTLTEAVQES